MHGKLPAAQRPFRILALPLARLPRSSTSRPIPLPQPPSSSSTSSSFPSSSASLNPKTPTPLLLFQVTQPDPPPEAGPPPVAQRILTRASDAWLKLGEKPKDSWTYWFYAKGESLMDRIEYEEWALKGVQEGRGVKIAKEGGVQEKIEIPLLYPTLKEQPLPPLLPKLHRLLIHRIPYHKKMMYRSLIFSPVTWPFAIIPVIPNFPLFYVLWRAWSHYKAWRGALYLENLLKAGMIVEKPHEALDEIYDSRGVVVGPEGSENVAPDSTSSEGVRQGARQEVKGSKSKSTPSKEYAASQGEMAEVGGLSARTSGQESAPDGTSTPHSQVYHADHERTKKEVPHPDPKVRHPAVLLGKNQVPLLARAFFLGPSEVVDVNRAVEQAEMRARAIDAQNVEVKAEGEGKLPPKTKWRGNLHR